MIRAYSQQDFEAVVGLFEANSPTFFDSSEKQDFVHYLLHEREDYFVVEKENNIIGAGGVNYPSNKYPNTSLSWGMIHPKFHRKGIGRKLTIYRLKHLQKQNISNVVVRTSQLTAVFYEKLGFKQTKVKKDYWAKGLDLYQMEITLC